MVPRPEPGHPAKHEVPRLPRQRAHEVHRQRPLGHDGPAAGAGELVHPGPPQERALASAGRERRERRAHERRGVLRDDERRAADGRDEVDQPPAAGRLLRVRRRELAGGAVPGEQPGVAERRQVRRVDEHPAGDRLGRREHRRRRATPPSAAAAAAAAAARPRRGAAPPGHRPDRHGRVVRLGSLPDPEGRPGEREQGRWDGLRRAKLREPGPPRLPQRPPRPRLQEALLVSCPSVLSHRRRRLLTWRPSRSRRRGGAWARGSTRGRRARAPLGATAGKGDWSL